MSVRYRLRPPFRHRWGGLLAALVVGCIPGSTVDDLAQTEPLVEQCEAVCFPFMYAVEEANTIQVGGFAGSVPPRTTVAVHATTGELLREVVADERGAFSTSVPGSAANLVIAAAGREATFAVRRGERDLGQAVLGRLAPTGTVPNRILIPSVPGLDTVAFVVNSGDNVVDNLEVTTGERRFPSLLLPDREGPAGPVGAIPWDIAVRDAHTMAVTLHNQRAVALADPTTGTLLDTYRFTEEVELPAPIPLPRPLDVDGDGEPEERLSRLIPRHPEAVAFAGGKLFVGCSNILALRHGEDPPVFGPGLVAIFAIEADRLTPAGHLFTRWANPQSFSALPDGRLLLAESGTLDYDPATGRWGTDESGIEILDPDREELTIAIDLGDGAPARAAATPDGERIYAGSLTAGVLFEATATGEIIHGPENPLRLNQEPIDSIFGIVMHPAGLAFATSFNTDSLYVIDTATDQVSPLPFTAPLAVGPGAPYFDGLQGLARRPGIPGSDFAGADLFVLGAQAAQITAVETRKVLGP